MLLPSDLNQIFLFAGFFYVMGTTGSCKRQTVMTSLLLVLIFSTLTDNSVSAASLGLGLHAAWKGLEKVFRPRIPAHQIRVRYPSGLTKTYFWTALRPILQGYLCKYCSFFPKRCRGHQEKCNMYPQ